MTYSSGVLIPYQFSLYPSEWPLEIFPSVGSDFSVCPPLLEIKSVCCYGATSGNVDCSRYQSSLGITSEEENEYSNVQSLSLFQDNQETKQGVFDLSENIKVYPNPFKKNFVVNYKQNEHGAVRIECLDTNGRLIRLVEASNDNVGVFEAQMDASDMPSGVYYLRVSTPTFTEMTKVVKAEN